MTSNDDNACPRCHGQRYEDCYIHNWRTGESQWTGAVPCLDCDGTGKRLHPAYQPRTEPTESAVMDCPLCHQALPAARRSR